MPDLSTNSFYGYKVRKPFQSESVFFMLNPDTPGMAAEDGQIVLNPSSKLKPAELEAVARNEAARLYMFENKIVPTFKITPEQFEKFQGSSYDGPDKEPFLKQTILARIVSGDPSAGTITPEQKQAADELLKRLKQRETAK